MASGSFTGSGSKVRLKISWSSSKGSGGSTVRATLYAVNISDYYFYATLNQGYSLTIDGSKKSGSTAKLSSTMNGTATLLSHSKWVSYTGNKSITISGYADMRNINVNGNLGTRSVKGTAVLDRVGSKPTMSSVSAPATSTISETSSTITVRWNKASSYSGSASYTVKVSINGASYSTVTTISSINTTSYTYTIPNKAQGTTYRFSVYASNDIGSSSTYYSGTVTINKLNAPTIGTINTYNPYVSSTLTVPLTGGSQTNGGTFKRMCALYYGSTWLWESSYNSLANGNTSVSITYAVANYLAKLGTSAYSSGNFRIVAWTQNANGTRSGYVEKYFTVNINTDGGATPTITAPTLSGGALNNSSTCFIAGVTDLVVTSATGSTRRAPSGTTLTYKISCTGATTQTGKTATFSGLTAGTKTITVTVTDSRGLSASVTTQCVVQSWSKPVVKITSCDRDEVDGTTAILVYSITYSPIYQYTSITTRGNQLNTITTQQYNLNNGNWTGATSGMTISNLSTESTYNLIVRASDKVKTTEYGIDSRAIPTITPILSMRAHGVGIMCVAQSTFAFEVNGLSRISSGLIVSTHGKTTANDGKVGVVIQDSGTNGGIEIVGNTPYLDFHQGNSASDYTHKIAAASDGFKFYSNTGIHWYTGTNGSKHAWIDSNGHMSISGNLTTTRTITAGAFSTSGAITASGTVTANTFKTGNWFRSTGSTGWYNDTYGGGVYMSDSTYVRVYNNKGFVVNGSSHLQSSLNTIGTHRFNSQWLGFYDSISNAQNNVSRKGWMGFDGSERFYIRNERSDYIEIDATTGGGICLKFGDCILYGEGNGYGLGRCWRPTGKNHGQIKLGASNAAWYRTYAQYDTYVTSDIRKKTNIKEFDDRFENLFMDLKGVTYELKKHPGQSHNGFIAQWVKESMDKHDISPEEFGAYIDEGDGELGIAYGEFVSLNTHMIQKAYKKIDEQQKEIDDLKAQVQELKELVLAMSKKGE